MSVLSLPGTGGGDLDILPGGVTERLDFLEPLEGVLEFTAVILGSMGGLSGGNEGWFISSSVSQAPPTWEDGDPTARLIAGRLANMGTEFLGPGRKMNEPPSWSLSSTTYWEEVIPFALRHKRECRPKVALVNTMWADLGRNETEPRPDPTCTRFNEQVSIVCGIA